MQDPEATEIQSGPNLVPAFVYASDITVPSFLDKRRHLLHIVNT